MVQRHTKLPLINQMEQEFEGALQALQNDKGVLQEEKGRLAQDLQERQSALDTSQRQGNEARQQLVTVQQHLKEATDAQRTAAQVSIALNSVYML